MCESTRTVCMLRRMHTHAWLAPGSTNSMDSVYLHATMASASPPAYALSSLVHFALEGDDN